MTGLSILWDNEHLQKDASEPIKRLRTAFGSVAMCVGICFGAGLRLREGNGSSGEVNGQIGRLHREGFPAIDFAHADLSGGDQRPEHHGGGFG